MHVARGTARINGKQLGEGDGMAVSNEPTLKLEGTDRDAEVLTFDLA